WGCSRSSPSARDPLPIQIAKRSDLPAVMRVVADHRPEDPPRGPSFAPIRQHQVFEACVVEAGQVADEHGVPASSCAIAAAAVCAESISGKVSFASPNAYSCYMTLHSATRTRPQQIVVNDPGSG